MDEYVLIFRHEDGSKVASPEQIQQWMKQTRDWMGGIAAQNKLIGGNGLSFENARIVGHNNVVTNGPFGDIKEPLEDLLLLKLIPLMKQLNLQKDRLCCREKGIRWRLEKLRNIKSI